MIASTTARRATGLALAVFAMFAPAPAAGETTWEATIFDAPWRATDIGGAPMAPDTEVELRLEPDGRAGGRGGCNRFTTQATIHMDTLTFAPLAATRMACAEEAMLVEAAFFAALEATRRFSFDPQLGELYLHDDEGSTLVRLERD